MTRPVNLLYPMAVIAALGASAGADADTDAQSRAAQDTSVAFGLAAREIDTSGSTSVGEIGLNAGATLPLGSLFAANFSASYASSTVRTREVLTDADGSISGVRPSCDIESSGGSLGLFARRPSLGRIGVSYGVGRLSSDCGTAAEFLSTGTDEMDSDHYRVLAEVYIASFTIAATRTSTDPDNGEKLESTAVTTSWYPLDNLRVSIGGNDLYDATPTRSPSSISRISWGTPSARIWATSRATARRTRASSASASPITSARACR